MEIVPINNHPLANKTVVITGASSGVGLATAEAFAKAGCNLILASRGKEALDKAVAYCQMVRGRRPYFRSDSRPIWEHSSTGCNNPKYF